MYKFKLLGTKRHDIDGVFANTPTILLINNPIKVRMIENYKVSHRNSQQRR